jgi:hypothetical protein
MTSRVVMTGSEKAFPVCAVMTAEWDYFSLARGEASLTFREARSEGEALRLRLAQAEARVAELQVRV